MDRERFSVNNEKLFEKDLNQLIGRVLLKELNPNQIKEETARLEKNWSQGRNYPKNIIYFLNALADHIEADYLHKAFRSFVFGSIRKENKDFSSLTRKEIAELYDIFPERKDLEEKENASIENYQKACEANWKISDLTSSDAAQIMLYDLYFRQAERAEDDFKKDHLLKSYSNFIPQIDNVGIQRECMLIWILRKWAIKNKKDHLMTANHALPHVDNKDKIDVVLYLGETINNLQIKAFSPDSYNEEFNEKLISETKRKITGTNINLLILNSEEIKNIFELSNKRQLDLKEKKNLTRKLNSLFQHLRGLLFNAENFLSNSENHGAEVKRNGLSRQAIIDNYSGKVDLLAGLGYLGEKDALNTENVLSAKKRFSEYLKNASPEEIKVIAEVILGQRAASEVKIKGKPDSGSKEEAIPEKAKDSFLWKAQYLSPEDISNSEKVSAARNKLALHLKNSPIEEIIKILNFIREDTDPDRLLVRTDYLKKKDYDNPQKVLTAKQKLARDIKKAPVETIVNLLEIAEEEGL